MSHRVFVTRLTVNQRSKTLRKLQLTSGGEKSTDGGETTTVGWSGVMADVLFYAASDYLHIFLT